MSDYVNDGTNNSQAKFLAALLRESAVYVERNEFHPIFYQTLGALHAFAGERANAVESSAKAAVAATPPVAAAPAAATAPPPATPDAAHHKPKLGGLGKKLQKLGVPVPTSTSTSPAQKAADVEEAAQKQKLHESNHYRKNDPDWCDEHFCAGCTCKSRKVEPTPLAPVRERNPLRPSFQRPVNPASTLIANGWIDQQRRSKMRVVWKEVLASLVEARKPGEETTLWIQREIHNPLTGKPELEALHQIPIKWMEAVEYIDYSTDHRFALRVFNVPEDFLFKCNDKESAQNWVITLRSVQDAIRKGSTHGGGGSTHGIGGSTHGSMRSIKEDPPRPSPTVIVLDGDEETGVSETETADRKPTTYRMNVKELRAIAHGAGVNTSGMERAELEAVVAQIAANATPDAAKSPTPTATTATPSPVPSPTTAAINSAANAAAAATPTAEEEQLRKQKQQRDYEAAKRDEELRRRQQAEVDVEQRRRHQVEEEQRRRLIAEEEQVRRIALEEEQRRRQLAEEEQRRRQLAEEELRRRKLADEELRRRKLAEDELRLRQAEEEKRRRAEDEVRRRKAAEEEQRRKQMAEEEQKRRQVTEEEQRRRQAAEAQAAEQRKRQEEAQRQQQQKQWHQQQQQQQWQQYQQQQQQWQQQQQHWQQQQGKHGAQQQPPFFAGQQPPPPPGGQPFHGGRGGPPPAAAPHNSSAPPQQPGAPNINLKYAKMADQSDDGAQATIIAIKRNILLHWALQPPMFQMLRPIDGLITSIHSVFPPAFGIKAHEYFAKWKPVTREELFGGAAMGNTPDAEKLTKSVRKLRFFLHPDKLPRDLTDEQQFMCKMLWDVTSDAWEEFQKTHEELDWIRK